MDRKKLDRAMTRIGCLALGLLVLVAWPNGALSQTPDDYVGTETCLECHDGMTGFANSVHGRLPDYQYPGLAEGCEACHGPGARHADTNEIEDIFIPVPDLGNEGVTNCLECHKTGHTLDWEFSEHAASDVACVSCHRIHGGGARPALLTEPEEKLCFGCHVEMKSKFFLPSHHPLKEGLMTCTSCHDVHGDRFGALADGEPTREACLSCHNEHAGPFIFEHSPVMEDCAICHDPHGAVANNLLHQNEPFLCLQCHQPHFHSILDGYEGAYSPPGDNPTTETPADGIGSLYPEYSGLSGTSHGDSMKRVMLTKCTQCHQSIHGTDLPSQSIPGQGRALNR